MRILAGTQTAYATQGANAPANGPVAQMSGKPGRFSLIKGQKTVIALKYPTGKRVSSRFGADQIMYTLACAVGMAIQLMEAGPSPQSPSSQ